MNKQDWKRGKIKDICDKASSNIAQNKIVGMNGEYPVFGASGFVQNVDFYHRDKPYIGIVKDGSGVGRVNLYPAYSSLLGTLQYIIPKDGNDIGFVSYALQSLKLSDFASGSAIPHIYFRDYGECEIPVPPLPTQQRIVAELDCISGILEKKRQQLKELDNLAQAIFYDMFGDPVENDKGWEVKKLGEVAPVIVDGVHQKPNYTETGKPFVSVVNINTGKLKLKDCKYVSEEDFAIMTKKNKAQKGDVLYTKVGATYGIPALVDTEVEFALYVSVCLIKPNHNLINSVFLCEMMRLPFIKEQANKRIKGIGVPDLHLNQIKEFDVILPPLSLQQQFAKKIEAIERQKALINQSIKEVQTLFDCRMEDYFN